MLSQLLGFFGGIIVGVGVAVVGFGFTAGSCFVRIVVAIFATGDYL